MMRDGSQGHGMDTDGEGGGNAQRTICLVFITLPLEACLPIFCVEGLTIVKQD